MADELTGQAVAAFVAIKDGQEASDALRKEFIMQVRRSIGPFAAPKTVHIVPDLPKTRSGKIMRRILRKILAGEEDQLGDITAVSTPTTTDCSLQCLPMTANSEPCLAVGPLHRGEDSVHRPRVKEIKYLFGDGRAPDWPVPGNLGGVFFWDILVCTYAVRSGGRAHTKMVFLLYFLQA